MSDEQMLTDEELRARRDRLLQEIREKVAGVKQEWRRSLGLSDRDSASDDADDELDRVLATVLEQKRVRSVEDRRRAQFDLVAQRRFLWHIMQQCRFAQRAYQVIDRCYERTMSLVVSGHVAEEQENQSSVAAADYALEKWGEEVAMAVQSFLIAAGNVSKCLWPAERHPVIPERGVTLRTLLEIEDDSILKDRDVRNFFEHYDDRLDRWAVGASARGMDALFGQSFGPETDELGYHDYELADHERGYNLRPILRALLIVEERANKARERIMEQLDPDSQAPPQFSRAALERWRQFRQYLDGLDLALHALEERVESSDDCVPLVDMLDVQRLVTAMVHEVTPFLESPRERDAQQASIIEADRHVRQIEDVLDDDPNNCVPYGIALEQIQLWRTSFERWWVINYTNAIPWVPEQLNPHFST